MPTYCGKAIVLSSIPYSESSLICKLYTEELGLKSYIVRSAKKKSSPTPTSHFQSLNIIEFEAYNSLKSQLDTIKTSSLILENQDLRFSIVKNALTFFVAEVVHLSLKEANPNKELFDYLFYQIHLLKTSKDEHLAEFHLYFMIQFAEHLGLAPMDNYSSTAVSFNPSLGLFSENVEAENFNAELSFQLHSLISNCKEKTYQRICKNKIERNSLLDALIIFYSIHITNHQPIKSHKILTTIL
jgi:DNA repair protein RecO (recombination protein O)